jgi:hypothetical protein
LCTKKAAQNRQIENIIFDGIEITFVYFSKAPTAEKKLITKMYYNENNQRLRRNIQFLHVWYNSWPWLFYYADG